MSDKITFRNNIDMREGAVTVPGLSFNISLNEADGKSFTVNVQPTWSPERDGDNKPPVHSKVRPGLEFYAENLTMDTYPQARDINLRAHTQSA